MSVNMTKPAFTTSVPLSILHTRPRLCSKAPLAHFRVPFDSPPGYALKFPIRPLCTHISPSSARVQVKDESTHRLTPAARARTLVQICTTGTLCTASQKHDGAPFGSHADYILDLNGSPIFLLANSAAHTKNLAKENRCSLFVQPASSLGQDGCRATLVGDITILSDDEVGTLQEAYIDTHAHTADALQLPNLFKFYRMNVKDIFFVAGYGVLSQWVSVEEFVHAEPDPLAYDAPAIVKNLNENKKDDLKRLCTVLLDDPDPKVCEVAALDKLGFDMRVRDSRGDYREYRVAFREQVSNRFDVQSALVKAFQEAWERENGYDETWAGEDARPTLLYFATSF